MLLKAGTLITKTPCAEWALPDKDMVPLEADTELNQVWGSSDFFKKNQRLFYVDYGHGTLNGEQVWFAHWRDETEDILRWNAEYEYCPICDKYPCPCPN